METSLDYPLELGWAYLLLAGYAARVAFSSLRLPGAVGVLLVGFAFSHFMQCDILKARDDLQRFAFFLVLLNAGFEVSVKTLRPRILLLSLLPGLLEMFGIAAVAVLQEDFTVVQGLLLGCVLFPLGEGLVIPKLGEFKSRFPGHPLPGICLTWAPIEATMALAVFGLLAGMSHPESEEGQDQGAGVLVSVVLLRIVATVAAGAAVGAAAGWLLTRIKAPKVAGRSVFTGTPVEAFLIVLGLGFASFGLARMVPMGFAPTLLFNPDLLVIAIGSAFADVASDEVAHGVENFLASIWVFASIILFSMIGSRTSIQMFADLPTFLPFMLVGLSCRLLGICIATMTSRHCRSKGKVIIWEILFFFLCCLPRATLQGALGGIPVQKDFFWNANAQGEFARNFVSGGARLYIVTFSIAGSLLLEFFGPLLLKLTSDAYDEPAPAGTTLTAVKSGGSHASAGRGRTAEERAEDREGQGPDEEEEEEEVGAPEAHEGSDGFDSYDSSSTGSETASECRGVSAEIVWRSITVSSRKTVYRQETR